MKTKIFLLFLIFAAALHAGSYTHKTIDMPPNSTAIVSVPANKTDMLECYFEIIPENAGTIFRVEYPDGTLQEGRSMNLDGRERIITEKQGNFKIYFINYYNTARIQLNYRTLSKSDEEYKKDWCPIALILLIPLLFIFSKK